MLLPIGTLKPVTAALLAAHLSCACAAPSTAPCIVAVVSAIVTVSAAIWSSSCVDSHWMFLRKGRSFQRSSARFSSVVRSYRLNGCL